jgi:hypothetical protein
MHQQQQQQKEEKDDALMRMIPRMLPNFEFLPGTVKMLWSQSTVRIIKWAGQDSFD